MCTPSTPAEDEAPAAAHRPALYTRARRLWLRISEEEYQILKTVARELSSGGHKKTVTDVVRESVNEYVGDYSERRVFERRTQQQPVAIERRSAERRTLR